MASSIRVFNQTRGCYMKRSQALKAVENCACAWLIFGVTVRNLTVSESIEARKAKKDKAPPLPFAEWHGCKYVPSDANSAQYRRGLTLVVEANRFAATCAA